MPADTPAPEPGAESDAERLRELEEWAYGDCGLRHITVFNEVRKLLAYRNAALREAEHWRDTWKREHDIAIQQRDERDAALISEREARHKLVFALREKDKAMDVLFRRLHAAGVDCSDLIS